MRLTGVAVMGGALAFILAVACGGPPTDSRIGVVEPDRTQFDPVGKLLDHRCGSLDCHGSAVRNLVIWGCEGLRLDPTDSGLTPKCRASGGKDTTESEYDATFRSLVGLEPAVMTAVVSGKGLHPELLTFVRKARGDESHKGGQLWTPGDPQDTCVATWLAGSTDLNACSTGLTDPPPP
jgi:hypothetical protein